MADIHTKSPVQGIENTHRTPAAGVTPEPGLDSTRQALNTLRSPDFDPYAALTLPANTAATVMARHPEGMTLVSGGTSITLEYLNTAG